MLVFNVVLCFMLIIKTLWCRIWLQRVWRLNWVTVAGRKLWQAKDRICTIRSSRRRSTGRGSPGWLLPPTCRSEGSNPGRGLQYQHVSTYDSPFQQRWTQSAINAHHPAASPWHSKPSGRAGRRHCNLRRPVPFCDLISNGLSRFRGSRTLLGSLDCSRRWQALVRIRFERNRRQVLQWLLRASFRLRAPIADSLPRIC